MKTPTVETYIGRDWWGFATKWLFRTLELIGFLGFMCVLVLLWSVT